MRHANARPVGGIPRYGPSWVPLQVELGDHRVVGVVQRDQLVALVGERRAALLEVRRDRRLAVVHVAGRDELVARVVERLHRHVELVPVLGLHVLAHDRLAALAQRRRGHQRAPLLRDARPVGARARHRPPVGRRERDLHGDLALRQAAQVDRRREPCALDHRLALAVDEHRRRLGRHARRDAQADAEGAAADARLGAREDEDLRADERGGLDGRRRRRRRRGDDGRRGRRLRAGARPGARGGRGVAGDERGRARRWRRPCPAG